METVANLGDLADVHAGSTDRLAFVDLRVPGAPEGYTYPELSRLVTALAARLAAGPWAAGDRVGIMSANRVEYVVAYLAIMKAGLVAVPINVRAGSDVLDHVVADAGVVLTFVDAAGRDALAGRTPSIDFDDPQTPLLADLAAVPHDEARAAVAGIAPPADGLAEILYTSGSSGLPKGVPLTHEGQLWALRTISSVPPARIETQIIAQPLFHMNGLVTLGRGLLLGFTTVLCPRFDAAAYVDAIERYGVTAVAAVPTMWIRVLRVVGDDRTRLRSVRALSLGSAPITEEQVARIADAIPDADVVVSYGTTETGPAIFGAHPDGIARPPLALGHPLPGSEVRLVDGPDADHGVLVMRNPAVTDGYRGLPHLTEAAFTDGWYSSGDVMRRDEHGFYYFVGRADDMFVCGGENIYPGELETILERHPAVAHAAVVSLPDDERGRIPVAFLVTTAGADLTAAAVKAFVIDQAPAYLYPRRVAVVDELPLAGTNKIDKRRLHELAEHLETSNEGWVA
ncbi:class I adenylate-forming enzyme family protein [Pimelobacter simplex]|uniref:O-succinylbenzoic acid--CoA ligase n=1 Tax=Nocardioides simplex TaxID=2045 RepID=A0A0A1DPC3_NOCSI|nr:class I adenylate-forming enzyme family protein [Pimelobacter simplex]AIY19266.1 O-succinylbenzoic acid--CoA ligase [Pimelobacter simplex]SFM20303.1 Acyl-CoA synthetase (AMP-forming)/AMP-acid ligase II [Pimelobacter simplex]